MRIGIITAMPEETGAVIRAIGKVHLRRLDRLTVRHGAHFGHEIMIAEAGMGFTNASATAVNLIVDTNPDMLVSVGFCGGISPELRVGDVVVALGLTVVTEHILDTVPIEILAAIQQLAASRAVDGCRVFGGLFVSTPVIVPKGRLAAMLPADASFPVVEMESAAIATVALHQNIPFAGIRSVSDPLDEEFGFSLDEFCDDRMRIRIPKVLLTVARKPRIIPQLVRLARNSRIAEVALARTIGQFLAFV